MSRAGISAVISPAVSPRKRAASREGEAVAREAAVSKRDETSPRDSTSNRRGPRDTTPAPTVSPARWQSRRLAGSAANSSASNPIAKPRPADVARPQRTQVAVGRAGDHPAVYQFLLAVFHGPSREEFHAGHDEPTYEPLNRLLIKRGSRVVSHIQLLKRTANFGPLQLAVDQAAWLGTLPEFRSQGFAGQLLQAAGRAISADGAPLGMLRTRIPHFFHRYGWAVCGRHSRSRGKARQIMARYWAEPALQRPALNIRLWRHVELPALMRIYAQNTAESYGPLVRNEAYWRWLINRKAFDYIIVALAGPDKLELDEATAPIVGYAVIRQHRIVELLTDPAYPTAGPQLLARACADAIERDQNDVVLEAPPADPLHQLIVSAEGQFHDNAADDNEVYMVKPPETARLVRRLKPLLESRLRASDVARACDLGLQIGDEKHLLSVSRRGLRLSTGRVGRNYLTCNRAEFARLALGHANPAEAVEHGRLQGSTQVALDLATLLFPRLPLWHPQWDDMQV